MHFWNLFKELSIIILVLVLVLVVLLLLLLRDKSLVLGRGNKCRHSQPGLTTSCTGEQGPKAELN